MQRNVGTGICSSGIVADGRALVDAAFTLKPDVIILDIGMPMLNGLDAGERIKREMPMIKLVFLSMNTSCDVVADAFRKGASAYVTKQTGVVELALAVRRVMRGEWYLSPLIARETLKPLLNNPGSAATTDHPAADRHIATSG